MQSARKLSLKHFIEAEEHNQQQGTGLICGIPNPHSLLHILDLYLLLLLERATHQATLLDRAEIGPLSCQGKTEHLFSKDEMLDCSSSGISTVNKLAAPAGKDQ